ncbi:MAG: hypothetical protein R6W77_12950 [Trueperaceae bacterium]
MTSATDAAKALLLALALALGTSVAVSMHADMAHGEDCDMPMFARGAPTVLSSPAVPPPPVEPPAPNDAERAEVLLGHDGQETGALVDADRCRGPPSTAPNDPV